MFRTFLASTLLLLFSLAPAAAVEPTLKLPAADWTMEKKSGATRFVCRSAACGKGSVLGVSDFRSVYDLEKIVRLRTGTSAIAGEVVVDVGEMMLTKTKLLSSQSIVAPNYAGVRLGMSGSVRGGLAYFSAVYVAQGTEYRFVLSVGRNLATADHNMSLALRSVNWNWPR